MTVGATVGFDTEDDVIVAVDDVTAVDLEVDNDVIATFDDVTAVDLAVDDDVIATFDDVTAVDLAVDTGLVAVDWGFDDDVVEFDETAVEEMAPGALDRIA